MHAEMVQDGWRIAGWTTIAYVCAIAFALAVGFDPMVAMAN